MKRSILCLCAVALPCLAADDKKDPEVLAKSLYDAATDVIKVIEGIKDKAGAEKAKPELIKQFDEMKKIEKEFKALSKEEKQKLEKAWEPKFDELVKRFEKEVERIRMDKAMLGVLADIGPFKAMDAKIAVARTHVLQIETALKSYYLRNGDYPKALADLEKGDKPFIEKGMLKDPWGKAYQYDPTGPKNRGLHPDVWTVDPSGKTIGNWLERPAPPKDK